VRDDDRHDRADGRQGLHAGPRSRDDEGHHHADPNRDGARPTNDDGRRETPVERADRNWNEILQELRVTQTGIQILTGFLLTVPFQARFDELNADQRLLYLVVVALAVTTTALLVAPVSLHRMLFRRRVKRRLVEGADRIMRVGIVFLGLTVTGVVLLVFDVVADRTVATVAAGTFLVLVAAAWFVLPRVVAARAGRDHPGRHTPG